MLRASTPLVTSVDLNGDIIIIMIIIIILFWPFSSCWFLLVGVAVDAWLLVAVANSRCSCDSCFRICSSFCLPFCSFCCAIAAVAPGGGLVVGGFSKLCFQESTPSRAHVNLPVAYRCSSGDEFAFLIPCLRSSTSHFGHLFQLHYLLQHLHCLSVNPTIAWNEP